MEEIYSDLWDRTIYHCDICGRPCYSNQLSEVEGAPGSKVCEDCARNAVVCEDCGEVQHIADMTECCVGGDENNTYFLCSNCIGGERIAEVEILEG